MSTMSRGPYEMSMAVRREQPAASSHRLPLTVDELVGAGARDESWERCRGVMVDADLAGALVDHEGGDALVCVVVHARNHLRERGAECAGGWIVGEPSLARQAVSPPRVGPRAHPRKYCNRGVFLPSALSKFSSPAARLVITSNCKQEVVKIGW